MEVVLNLPLGSKFRGIFSPIWDEIFKPENLGRTYKFTKRDCKGKTIHNLQCAVRSAACQRKLVAVTRVNPEGLFVQIKANSSAHYQPEELCSTK